MTHRQYLLWKEFSIADLEHPSRDNYYAMQLTQAVSALTATVVGILTGKRLPDIDLNGFKIKFEVADNTVVEEPAEECSFGPKRLTKETLLKAQKEIAKARMGIGVNTGKVKRRHNPYDRN